jgi:hypothetical protein
MGAGEHEYLMKRLSHMERTISLLHQRVSRLQRDVDHSRGVQTPGFLKGRCLRVLLGRWRQRVRDVAIVRQNRRVERHAASLF